MPLLMFRSARNDYLIDGEILTQSIIFTLLIGAMGVLISPLF